MSVAAMENEYRVTTAKMAKTKITRIGQVIRKANEGITDLQNLKDQMDVILARNLERANDVNEMKDLFGQMDKVFDKMEHL
jgi:hypothetical protein